MGDPGPRLGEPPDLCIIDIDAVGVPNVVPHPPQILHELDGTPSERLDAELLLVVGLGDVGVKMNTMAPCQGCRFAHQIRGHGER